MINPTKEKIYIGVIILLIAFSSQVYYTHRYLPAREVQVYYNQDRQLNKELIQVIQNANEYIYFAIYTFTRLDIKDALLAAHYRGVKIAGVVDRKQTHDIELQNKIVAELRADGIPVFEHDHTAIMHLKALVTEKQYVSGSFNWTASATNLNDEVLEIGSDPTVRKQYEDILKTLIKKYTP
jgi:phosphatidylserine/phosphatidylglycerophosphate/cardiolipin synthase-like enzyme